MSATGSLLSLCGDPEAESLVPSSIVSWRIILAVCRRVRSSFLPLSSVSPGLPYPTPSLSLLTTSLSLSWLLQSSAWSSLVSCSGLHRLHDWVVLVRWCGGAVIHSAMVLLSCGLVRHTSSFLPVFSVSPTFPTQHSLPPCIPFPYFFLAASFFGVEQLVIVLELAAFSRLCRHFHYWFLTSDSQSFYSGRDTLWYSSVDYFLSSTQLGVVLLRRAGSGKYTFRSRSSGGVAYSRTTS